MGKRNMTDVTESINALLEIQGLDLSKTTDHNALSNLLIECRDEIEKLRTQVAGWIGIHEGAVLAMQSEITRLREENGILKTELDYQNWMHRKGD